MRLFACALLGLVLAATVAPPAALSAPPPRKTRSRRPQPTRPGANKPPLAVPDPNKFAHPELLVEPEWLQSRLSDPTIRVVDLRDAERYIEGHLPNAIHFAPDFLRYGEDRETYLPPVDLLQRRLRAMGVSDNTHLIVYDDAEGRMPSRFWLVLLNHGHTRVSLLNGWLKRWRAEGRDINTEVVRLEPGNVTLRGRGPIVCALKDVKPAKDVVLLDARAPEEFQQGHIPGAVQVNWKDNVREDGTFKSPKELRDMYQKKGVTKDREITTYCNNGARAAHAAFTLTLLGYPRIRVYYGSMLDYGQRHAPVEQSP